MDRRRFLALLGLGALGAACRPASPTPTPPPSPTATPSPASASPTPATAQTDPSAAGTDRQRFRLVPEQSEARYRVREQLAGRSLPSDAVGTTKALAGGLTLRPDGQIVAAESRFSADLRTLRSDEGRRDAYLQRNVLQTDRYPTATFVPRALRNFQPPPAGGETTFQVEGDLTIRDVTRPVVWEGKARLVDRAVSGQATTRFTFADFNLPVPRVAMVLSVEETIRLEVDFFLVPEA